MEQGLAYRIVPVDQDRSVEIKQFVMAMMSELYPKGSYYENPRDLAFFGDVYLRPTDAQFIVAEDAAGRIVGTSAVRPYDGRFSEVQPMLGSGPICEIVKFYVHPAKRKSGIGSRMYAAAERFAREAGYRESYLHTSLFLPGGYPFWQSRGYLEQYWESEEVVHMTKRLLTE
ncbi:GNAT family N-acetyltransferase [Paenibacillaceae bacterium WGS1546]|uniref:GNAT family N-acetyltransferase n=1 Tax=Cohnella sp. WGS1546 TaxID=3366810 RepID=UPI00372D011B